MVKFLVCIIDITLMMILLKKYCYIYVFISYFDSEIRLDRYVTKKMTIRVNIWEGSYWDGGKTKVTLHLYNFDALMLLSFL